MRMLFLAAFAALLLGNLAQAKTLTIDAGHSSVLFKVKHLNVAPLYGRFNTFAGTFDIDDTTGDLTGVTVTIQATSVDTGIVRRDDHLRSNDFFSTSQYPEITFQSTSVQRLAEEEGAFALAGNLTLLGVTRPVTLVARKVGETVFASPRGDRLIIGAEGSFKILRTDFGMNKLLESAGDEIEILLGFEGNAPVD